MEIEMKRYLVNTNAIEDPEGNVVLHADYLKLLEDLGAAIKFGDFTFNNAARDTYLYLVEKYPDLE